MGGTLSRNLNILRLISMYIPISGREHEVHMYKALVEEDSGGWGGGALDIRWYTNLR